MISHIFHIADIHIFDRNYKNIQYAFDNLIADIKKYPDSMLVIAGDVFEHKSSIAPGDIKLFHNIVEKLNEEEIATIIIPGNHDFNNNKKTGDHFMDTISALLINTNYEYVQCYSETGIYNISNIDFYVFSPVDKKIPDMSKLDGDNYRMAIIHEPVEGCSPYDGPAMKGQRFSPEYLSDTFDVSLLGDIHKHQFLKPTVAYPGSFVQKNKGEGVTHGYILWTLPKTKTPVKIKGQFYPLRQYESYVKIYANENKYTFPLVENARYISIEHTSCSDEFIKTLAKGAEEKYKRPVNIFVCKDDLQIKGEEDCKKIKTNIDQHNMIKDILETQGVDEEKIAEVLDLHTKYLRDINPINHTVWVLNYLTWGNIMCYGENNYINFKNINGITSIIGANKTGKSCIIDILIWILFNVQIRGNRKSIINQNKPSAWAKCSFNIGPDEYIIERYIQSVKDQAHRLYRNGVNITGNDIRSTYDDMSQLLGPYKDFTNIVAAIQNRRFLVDMLPEEKFSFICHFLGIDVLEKIETDVKLMIRDCKSKEKTLSVKSQEEMDLLRQDVLEQGNKTKDICQQIKMWEDKIDVCQEEKTQLALLCGSADYKECKDEYTKSKDVYDKLVAMLKVEELNKILKDLLIKNPAITWTGANNPSADKAIADVITQLDEEIIQCLQERARYPYVDIEDTSLTFNGESKDSQLTYGKLKLKIRSLEKLIKPLTKRRTKLTHEELTQVVDPGYDIDELKYSLPKKTPKRTSTDVTVEMVDKIPSLEKMLTKCEKQLKLVDKNQVAEIEAKLAKISKTYASIRYNDSCECCIRNKRQISGISGRQVLSDRLDELHTQETLNNTLVPKINKLNVMLHKYRGGKVVLEGNQILDKAEEIYEKIRDQQKYIDAQFDLEEMKNQVNIAQLHRYEIMFILAQNQKYREADEKFKKAKARKNVINIYKSYGEAKIKYTTAKEKLKIAESNKDNLEFLKKISEEIKKIQITLKKLKSDQIYSAAEFEKLNYTLKDWSKKSKLAENIRSEKMLYELYLKCINKKTGLPSLVIASACKTINSQCNILLDGITDFQIKFAFNKTITIDTVTSKCTVPADVGSGFQKFIMDLVLRICLSSISQISRPGIMFIDEGFGCLDKDNFAEVVRCLSNVTKLFKIVVISHIVELQTLSNTHMTVTSTNFESKIMFGDLTDKQQKINLIEEVTRENTELLVERKRAKTKKKVDAFEAKEKKKKLRDAAKIVSQEATIEEKKRITDEKYEKYTMEDMCIVTEDPGKYQCLVCDKILGSASIQKHINTKMHVKKLYTWTPVE